MSTCMLEIFLLLIPIQVTFQIHPLFCYKENATIIGDILDVKIPKNQGVFLIETSCLSEHFEQITLERRQLCALESVAKTNPNKKIYMIFMAKTPPPTQDTTPSSKMVMEIQRTYDNIQFVNVNFFKYIEGTPVENVGRLIVDKYSAYSYLYANDILKLVTLWRYGGIYLDLDVIVLKSLHKMPRNFLGAESDSRIGSAVMGFSSEEFGREYVTKMMEEYSKSFVLGSKISTGSNFFSKIIKMICKETNTSTIIERGCEAIKVFPQRVFYPISWNNWTELFDARQTETIWKLIEKSFMVHFWNRRSYFKKLRVNSFAPYVELARSFCPVTFNLMEDYL